LDKEHTNQVRLVVVDKALLKQSTMQQATGTGLQFFQVYYKQVLVKRKQQLIQRLLNKDQLATAQQGLGQFLPSAQRADITDARLQWEVYNNHKHKQR
jgi:hypothetical protein